MWPGLAGTGTGSAGRRPGLAGTGTGVPKLGQGLDWTGCPSAELVIRTGTRVQVSKLRLEHPVRHCLWLGRKVLVPMSEVLGVDAHGAELRVGDKVQHPCELHSHELATVALLLLTLDLCV